jgi:hypothetical protein
MNTDVPTSQRPYTQKLNSFFEMERNLQFIYSLIRSESTRVPIDAWEEKDSDRWRADDIRVCAPAAFFCFFLYFVVVDGADGLLSITDATRAPGFTSS